MSAAASKKSQSDSSARRARRDSFVVIRRSRSLLATLVLATLGAAIAAAPASAVTAAPAWRIDSHAAPTNLVPGVSDGRNMFLVTVVNTGGTATDGSDITITDDLPAGFTVQPSPIPSPLNTTLNFGIGPDYQSAVINPCDPGPPVVCHFGDTVQPGERLTVQIPLQVPASAPPLATVSNHVTVSGGGAANPAEATGVTPFNADPAPFGIQQLSAWFSDVDGSAVTQAGAHPFASRIRFGVNTNLDTFNPVGASEDPKDVTTTLPPGVVVNPTVTPRCSEADFEQEACSDSSAIGVVDFTLGIGGFPAQLWAQPAFNVEAPPGSAASIAFNPNGLGFYFHILGGVDPAHGYALQAKTSDISQYGLFTEATVDLWGDPSDPAHDHLRGAQCDFHADHYSETCPVSPISKPLLTMPSACSSSLSLSATATSWQNQNPGGPVSASATVTKADGTTPAPVDGCDSLAFAPTLTARPTTNVADSPSGLDVDLQVPQSETQDTRATSTLRKAVVTLPPGLTLNPSAANGLEACSSAQIGIDPNTGTPNGKEPTCPDASKLGTVEVTTPLLDNPLPGSVYLAKPHDNPFDSELAIYLVIDDPQSGVIVKLPGKVEADPATGQLITTVDQNPQLPFSEFKLNFFGGATGALRTPDTCGDYSTTSELTPWSSSTSTPVTPPDDTYSISQGPNGSCPTTEQGKPNSPGFDAGTVSPLAGEHTPFVLNLHRDDATQQFSSVTLSPPPGLVAKLAGTPACSEAGIAQAQSRTASGDGALEQSDPSCPDTSKVGVVHVGAGAGPAPYYVTGNVYLAGPYKNQPLSFVIITPAVAGPFDLGVVVTRVAIAIDPTTAQITATADPIPDHLTVDGDGFPLDVRSVQMKLDKPDFTLNGSSCDPTSISGSLLSTQSQTASLSEPFQLAECANLGFKPRLGMRLRGGHFRNGHPAFTSVLNARAGDANIGKASVILPPSMQLDQSHIQAPCTRPQFAADQCPAASIIGSVVATSPLLDYKLTGPVYLRTGDNPLPDMVLDLHGPASQPIRIDQVGKIDTVHARLRTTFQGVPDAPISQAIIRLVGGHKGLLVNNTNLCKQPNRAAVFLDGHNNATADSHPRIALKCPKARKKHKQHKRHHRRHHTRHSAR